MLGLILLVFSVCWLDVPCGLRCGAKSKKKRKRFKSAEMLPDMEIMGTIRTKEVPLPRDKKN
jgi:hypothetical protein